MFLESKHMIQQCVDNLIEEGKKLVIDEIIKLNETISNSLKSKI